MENPAIDQFIEMLAEALMGSDPSLQTASQIGRMREGLFVIARADYPKLQEKVDEAIKTKGGCSNPECLSCGAAWDELSKQFALMRKIIEPHKAEILEMLKRSRRLHKTLVALSQMPEHGN
jgi:hypothetical protein